VLACGEALKDEMIRGVRSPASPSLIRDLAAALLAPALALAATELLWSKLGLTRLGIVFLAAVILIATIRGSRAAILTAVTSLVAYKVFLDLRAGEQTSRAEDILNLAIFLVVALVAGTLAGKARDEASKALRHSQRMETLFKASRSLSEDGEQTLWTTLTQAIAADTGGRALALDASGAECARIGGKGNLFPDAEVPLQLGRRTLAGKIATARTADGWTARAIPQQGPRAGVLLWEAHDPTEGFKEFAELLVELASAALARSRLRAEQLGIEAAKQAERFREALLSSISHDFRSPLAAIIGSTSSLLEYGDKFEPAVREDLLLNIQEEAERLNAFVANLLDMTRLQSGNLRVSSEPLLLAEIVSAAVRRLERHKRNVPLIAMHGNCELNADPLLLEQALYNILDNAVKYAAADGDIDISCVPDDDATRIVIADHGPGLRAEDQAGVFDAFHFLRKNKPVHGTGLGLSISRGFVEAMKGRIEARNRTDGQSGLEVAITLPRGLS
jgi:two-component system sensor histidine kinase KdpD